ncbi:MAG TPA: hypothetical protein VJU83_05135 [Burkholderiales bacterium]|nr:hypothetical protein [Burkholderiales bacterium]
MQTLRNKLLIVAALSLVLALIWLQPLDTMAQRHVESGFQRALTTFAVARTLNAVLSVVQSTSVGVHVGVGASVHPGAILEPIDDLIEQFSAIMLVATLSFAAQGLMLHVASAWPVSALLTVFLISWGFLRARGARMSPWLPRLAIGLLCLRLSVPMLAMVSEATYQLVFSQDYAISQGQLEIAKIPDNEALPDESFTDRAKRWWSQSTEINKKVEALKAKAEALVEHVIRLAAIFIVQTAVLPLLFFWFVLWLYRGLTRSPWIRQQPRRLQSET